jgi:hypothetical protein
MKCIEELIKEFEIPEGDEDSQKEWLYGKLEEVNEESQQFELLEKYTKLIREDFEAGNAFKKHYYDEDNKSKWIWNIPDLLDTFITSLCDRLFITSGGGVNYANKFKAEEDYNVRIYPGEKDSFGWLTGVYEIAMRLRVVFG